MYSRYNESLTRIAVCMYYQFSLSFACHILIGTYMLTTPPRPVYGPLVHCIYMCKFFNPLSTRNADQIFQPAWSLMVYSVVKRKRPRQNSWSALAVTDKTFHKCLQNIV